MLREASRQETRDGIIDAAERLLERYGYSKMTMTDLAEEAGIGVGTTYLYFPGKIDVALAVLERQPSRVRARLKEITAETLSPGEKLRMMLMDRLTLRYESARKRRHQIEEFKKAVQSAVEERRAGWLAAEAEIMAAVLDEGRKTGVFEFNNSSETAATLIRATSSMAPRNLTQQEFEHPEEYYQHLDQIVTLLLRGLQNHSQV
jgi:AcrR family transcriptional regulator